MTSALVANVADLVHRPGARRRERLEGILDPAAAARVAGTSIPPDSLVVVETLLESVSDGILASGRVIAPWESECRRCLRPVQGRLVVEFRELFEERPREGESYRLRHDHVDLEPLAREALLLELPWAPLCAEHCRGLCPECGADLNLGECGCVVDDRDPRWAALDALRPEAED